MPKNENTEQIEMIKRARIEIPRRLGYDEIWTQAQMAGIVGVSTNYWARIERGDEKPSSVFLSALDLAMRLAAHDDDPRARSVW
jgi:transcriptional regulator with XRE-family HTH domain